MDNEWKLVPVEWTQEMLDACIPFIRSGKEYHKGRYIYNWHMAPGVGSAVIAAAPQPPSVGREVLNMKNVMIAYENAGAVHLSGTSNFCAVMAKHLNNVVSAQVTARDQQIANSKEAYEQLQNQRDRLHKQLSAWQGLAAERLEILTAAQARIQQLEKDAALAQQVNKDGE